MPLPSHIYSALVRFEKAAKEFGAQPQNLAAQHQHETARERLERAIEKALDQ